MNVQQAKTHVDQTFIDLEDIRRQGGHREACEGQAGEAMFDYTCNLCKVTKNWVQAKADLAAAEAYEACSTPAGE